MSSRGFPMVSNTPSVAIAMVQLVRCGKTSKRSGTVATATDLAMAELNEERRRSLSQWPASSS